MSDDREVEWRHVWSASYTWWRRKACVFSFRLKIGGDDLSVVWPQNHCDGFLVWASKPRSTVWWFRPQNNCNSLLVWASKPRGESLLVCALKPMSGWWWCEDTRQHPMVCFIVKQVGLGFPSFASKLVKKRWRAVHVASSRRSRGSEAKDDWFDGVGCGVVTVGANYPSLLVVSF
jgi:hypothetical protein